MISRTFLYKLTNDGKNIVSSQYPTKYWQKRYKLFQIKIKYLYSPEVATSFTSFSR